MTLVSDDFCKVDLLAHMWRYPTVSIHGIEGAFSDSGTKTVIPAKVTAKFSIRQVPDMDPAMVKKQVYGEGHPSLALRLSISIFCTFALLNCCGIIGLLVVQVTDYLQSVFAKRKSPNKLKVTMVIGAKPWLANTEHPLYEAGKAAVRRGASMQHCLTLKLLTILSVLPKQMVETLYQIRFRSV